MEAVEYLIQVSRKYEYIARLESSSLIMNQRVRVVSSESRSSEVKPSVLVVIRDEDMGDGR